MRAFCFLLLPITLVACTSSPVTKNTLRDIDIVGDKSHAAGAAPKLRNEAAIREAYAEYLRHASKQDISRIDALQRLAQLEFELIDKLARNKGEHTTGTLAIEDKIHSATLDRSIEFLEITLRDYPDAPGNDKSLYHLARAYDQKGEYEKSLAALQKLVLKYPKSSHYIESQFRLAEAAFSKREYSKAEDIYTDILVSQNNKTFRDNARYKRGWARFKQEYYQDAVDDFVQVVQESGFKPYETLGDTAKNQFDEYFRALGLSFSYLGGAPALTEYFKSRENFAYIFETYAHVSEIYQSQQRYSDAAGIFETFIRNHPESKQLPYAGLRIVEIWKASGFTDVAVNSLESFYTNYHPQSKYWSGNNLSQKIYNDASEALRENIVLAASHFHKEFNKTGKQDRFELSRRWYERYLKHYRASSQKDNIHYLYAELLQQNKRYPEALRQYELAAFDEEIILSKEAAYASILMATRLHRDTSDTSARQGYLDKLIKYSLVYIRLYPNDQHAANIMTHAAQESYHAGMYKEAINLTELYGEQTYTQETYNIHVIKAHAYFKLGQYRDAEAAYKSVLANYRHNAKTEQPLRDNLAVAIYNQADDARKEGRTNEAISHYTRIIDVAPGSTVAATGLYDAIALSINNEMWGDAIQYIKRFQTSYPTHKYSHDVSKKLSVAYLKSDRDIEAASELVKISRTEQDTQYKSAALWKAAELYEARQDWPAAIRAYQEYTKNHPQPYPQYIESMHKLVELNTQTSNSREADKWREAILNVDRRTPADQKTDRSRFLASRAALDLAREKHQDFASVRLTLPLKQSLQRKKHLMQEAVNLYGRASAYGVAETATEAVHTIGDIYRDFSKALLASDRPKNLNTIELEQYNILLEDQAYPFEDKAIEFYETNLAHVKDGVFDDWMQKSYLRLTELFPARYDREIMLEPYINVLH